MKIGFCGLTHLGETLRKASELRGFDTAIGRPEECDIVFVTPDVEDHDDLSEVEKRMSWAVDLPIRIPVVLVSQVPPGFTRPWLKKRGNIFYQVDTIIMNHALVRATFPERFIVGCEDLRETPPAPYAMFLAAFNCPIVTMSFESAEYEKMVINYLLADQLKAVNKLAGLAPHVGANWDEMIPGLRLDARIGPHAYLRPGEPNGHLPRDVRTIERLLKETK